MKTDESKLEVQQEQLDIPVVSGSICYYNDNGEKYINRYKKIHGESFINEREFILVEFIDGTCTSIDKRRLIYCH